MAKTKGPLMSLDAHGSFGRVLTYSHRKSGRQVRTYNKPLVAATAKQRAQRRLTEFLVAQWQNMSAGDKATWEANARLSGPNITGYHYFLREAQRDLYTHHGLCGYWHCNEIVGGKVLDLSGNANHGTLKPSHPANAPVLIDSYKTKFSKGLLYDGVDEYIEVANKREFTPANPFSVSAWVYMHDSRNFTIVSKGVFNTDWEWLFWLDANNKVRFFIADESVDDCYIGRFYNHSLIGQTNKWLNFIATYDGGVLSSGIKIYLNTVRIDDTDNEDNPGSFVSAENLAHAIWIGRYHDKYSEGVIDEVCIYNRELSAAEILTRYRFTSKKAN